MSMDRKIKKKRWTPKRIVILSLSGLFIIFVIYTLLTIKSNQLRVNKERLTVSTVTKGPFQEFIPVLGEVIPIDTRYLVAAEGGRIEKIFSQPGNYVKIGDRILKLSNTNLLLDIMYREAELYRQSNNLRNTKLDLERYGIMLDQQLAQIGFELKEAQNKYERYTYLFKEKLVSKQDFETAENNCHYQKEKYELTRRSKETDVTFRQQQIQQLESSLNRMGDNLKIIMQKQDELTIKAPIEGLLSLIEFQIGESMPRGTRLGQVDVINSFKVRARIDQHYITRVEAGRTGTFPYSGKDFKLKSTMVYPEVEENEFKVDFVFLDQQPQKIRRGQTLHIRFELGDLEEALLLPKGGFYQKSGGYWIFILNEKEQRAIKKDIKLGRQNPLFFEVLEGLKPGDKVITSSYDNFGKAEELILKDN
jgi:HlyD family secretion protein